MIFRYEFIDTHEEGGEIVQFQSLKPIGSVGLVGQPNGGSAYIKTTQPLKKYHRLCQNWEIYTNVYKVGEAQSAESRSDFIHKIKVVLKELRETRVWLLMISKAGLIGDEELADTIRENGELISIFVRSAETARSNKRKPS